MANDGPLPTPFVTNQACDTEMARVYKLSPYLLQGPPTEYIRCMPDKYVPSSDHYYSPNSECPSGYTSACQQIQSVATETGTWLTCCPTQRNFQCQTNPGTGHGLTLGCVTTLPRSPWTLTSVVWESEGTTSVETIHTGPPANVAGSINAYSVQLRYVAAGETPGPTSTFASASDTDSAPKSFSVSASATGAATGLPTGAAVGVGVGAALAFVALVAAAVFLGRWMRQRRRRRRQRNHSQEPASSTVPPGQGKPEAHRGGPASSAPPPPPQDGVPDCRYAPHPGYELDARGPDPELPVDRHNTPEMPAQSPQATGAGS